MTGNNTHNAVTERLEKLASLWEEFTTNPEFKICRWIVELDEYPMLDAFYEFEASEGGNLSDVFLRFETAFGDKEKYGHELYADFCNQIEADRKDLLKEEGIDIKRKAYPKPKMIHPQLIFPKALAEFVEAQEEIEGLIVAYLSPAEISDVYAWIDWLGKSLEAGIPEHVRFMIIDTTVSPVFDQLLEDYPTQVKSIEPKLDMDAAMAQIASLGDPNQPGVQYRMAYVALTQAAAKKDWDSVYREAAGALQLAKAQFWPQLEVAVHMAVGGAELGARKRNQAMESYQRAIDRAKQAHESHKDDLYLILLIQAYFGQGSTLIADEEHEQAAKVYESAAACADQMKAGKYIPYAEEENQVMVEGQQKGYYQLESWRMAGYCYTQTGGDYAAWESYQKALEAGLGLNEQERQGSTLPYVGQAMISLALDMRKHEEAEEVQRKMDEGLGKGWEEKIETRK